MRKELKKLKDERIKIFGEFERFGLKSGYFKPQETVLILNLKDELGNILADHIWFNKTKGFEKLDLKKGDKIELFARVEKYKKGYQGYNIEKEIFNPVRWDYKLTYPTKVSKL